MHEYDVAVIGGGAAGLVAAGMSALLGARTALIEEHRLGGDCTWTGCIPSKTLIHAARVAHEARVAESHGLIRWEPQVNFAAVMRHVRQIREEVYQHADAPPQIQKLGVEVIASRAEFIDPHTIQLNGRRLTSRYFVIATGSRPRLPGFEVPVLTNETLFELEEQPRRLLVLGAGPVGMEMAQAFQRLGSEVTVVETGDYVLPKDDPELTSVLHVVVAAEGVRFLMGRKVVALERRHNSVLATLDTGEALECDRVFAGLGREPVVSGLGLEQAGVQFTPHGIAIDSQCRTSQLHIFASGDVTGKYLFTHMAEQMSRVAVSNAILKIPRSMDERRVTWCTFTSPQLAHVGASTAGEDDVYRFPFSQLDRAITESSTTGTVKVLASRSGVIRGASILGENAGEMIAEWALAMRHGLKLKDIADTVHPYPTYALGNRQTADEWYRKRLGSPLLGLLGKAFGYRGRGPTGSEME
jgi:pyruvate/2-oxoglutarate dehydrogenase complex dihydrolipoamide dehydrogenase (E3) component